MLKFNLRKLILLCASYRDVDPSVIKAELGNATGMSAATMSGLINTPVGGRSSMSFERVQLIETYFEKYLQPGENKLTINQPVSIETKVISAS